MKNILLILLAFLLSGNLFAYQEFIDPNPSDGNLFGNQVVLLRTGNVVITSPGADINGISNCGAVYLFNGKTRELISTLYGTTIDDSVGSERVTALNNGNYVVCSVNWDYDTQSDIGAVTWCDGTKGINGPISIDNSLVGIFYDPDSDRNIVYALKNGNYVVCAPFWHINWIVSLGAVSWCDGSKGKSGMISSSNSLVGENMGDLIGIYGITELSNGNFVVSSPFYSSSSIVHCGAVTWCSGTEETIGTVNFSNSLIGSSNNDLVGYEKIVALENGNYIVCTNQWDNGDSIDVGAVTWCDGSKGFSAEVNKNNSLIGTSSNDLIGFLAYPLKNGNYVVASRFWNNNENDDAGAVTWGDGEKGTIGEVSISNSLIGTISHDGVGRNITVLTNGNYVVCSTSWNKTIGAITWCDGTKQMSGAVSIENSLVGTRRQDLVGCGGTAALYNGNYVVISTNWNNIHFQEFGPGAVTWCDGAIGRSGEINNTNSLLGSSELDAVGIGGISVLPNSNYIISSYKWNNGDIVEAGAVTLCDGTNGTFGEVSIENSIVGSSDYDNVGIGGATALSNGNYVINSYNWNLGSIQKAGAVTWCKGENLSVGNVTSTNSLVGSIDSNKVGYDGIIPLPNGNYLVTSYQFTSNLIDRNAFVTWGNGTTGTNGTVNITNSVVWTSYGSFFGNDTITILPYSNYVISSKNFKAQFDFSYPSGAATWCSGLNSSKYQVSELNSIIYNLDGANLKDVIQDEINKRFYVSFNPNNAPGKVFIGLNTDDLFIEDIIPASLKIDIFYPNPTSSTISTKLELLSAGFVSIVMYDITGRRIKNLFEKSLSEGTQQLSFDVSDIQSGSYQLVFTKDIESIAYPISIVK